MEEVQPLSISGWLDQASAAMKSGDSVRARECALAAAHQDPLCEQAWLILASLSQPEQAMLYLENALRANPRSRAARKAVRLVFSRLKSAQNAQTPDEPDNEPDPAALTIPTPLDEQYFPERSTEGETLETPEETPKETPEETQTRQEILDYLQSTSAPSDANLPASSPQKTGRALRLRKRSEPASQPPASRGGRIRFIRKVSPQTGPPGTPVVSSLDLPAAMITEKAAETSESITPVVPAEAPAIPSEIKTSGTLEPVSSETALTAPTATEAEESPSSETSAREYPFPAKLKRARKPAPLPAPERSPARPKKQRAQKKAADRPLPIPDQPSAGATRGMRASKKAEPADVDMIELVLVSVAAIVLPLIVFLYFYLAR